MGRRLKEYGEIKFERSDIEHLIFHLKRSLIDSGDNNESDLNCPIAARRWKLLNGIEIVNMISSNTPHIFYSFIFYLSLFGISNDLLISLHPVLASVLVFTRKRSDNLLKSRTEKTWFSSKGSVIGLLSPLNWSTVLQYSMSSKEITEGGQIN